MPGDELLASSQFTATRAITIDAPREAVWPWLAQVGVGRGGFYSYDWLDNHGRHSSRVVLPEWQEPRVGDLAAPMVDAASEQTSFRIHIADQPHTLVWSKADSTWTWLLTPIDGGRRTRLVTRLRSRYDWSSPGVLVSVALLELADFPMMRRMLLGIRQRAEAGTVPPVADNGGQRSVGGRRDEEGPDHRDHRTGRLVPG